MSGPFKMKGYSYPGESPLEQDYTEALEHHKKYMASKKMPPNFNMTKSKDLWLKQSKELLKKAGGKALGVAGMMMATSSKADQPVVKTKKMSEESMKSVQTAISQQMNPLKK